MRTAAWPTHMKALLVITLLIIGLPLAAADPINERPLCEGEPLVDLEWCGDGAKIYTCTSDDQLRGAGCFYL